MLLITKELAEAVLKSWEQEEFQHCLHCGARTFHLALVEDEVEHDDNCIVVRAQRLLEQEFGVKSE